MITTVKTTSPKLAAIPVKVNVEGQMIKSFAPKLTKPKDQLAAQVLVQKWSDINAEGGATVDSLEALANGDKNNEKFPYNPDNVVVEK